MSFARHVHRRGAPPEPTAWQLLAPPTLVYGLVVLLAGGAAGWLRGPRWELAALIALGFLCWTLLEYVVHRFVQHAPPHSRRAAIDDHGYHHRFPDDVGELVYEVRHSLLGLLPAAAIGWLATWELAGTLAVMSGIALGYLAYEWLHLCSHRPALVRGSPLLQRLARNHHRHHYEDGSRHFGFVTPLWDVVFRTHR